MWFETVRPMMALSALVDWYMRGVDMKRAFLYGELEEELYVSKKKALS